MKKILVLFVGISLFLAFALFTTATMVSATSEPVTSDGKMLHFPGTVRYPVYPFAISRLEFDLKKVPPGKEFIEGKIFEFRFFKDWGGFFSPTDATKYAIFTKWTEGRVEIFWYPVFLPSNGEQAFLDCIPSNGNGDELACKVRGRTVGNSYHLTFEGQKLKIRADDQCEADSEVVGEIPIPLPATQATEDQTQTRSPW